jgi:lambda repressor-like predicted transcriptional regulator
MFSGLVLALGQFIERAGYRSGQAMTELARQFGIERPTVAAVLDRANVSRRHELTAGQLKEAAQLYEAGWSATKLGERFDVSPDTMLRRLRRFDVAIRPRRGGRPAAGGRNGPPPAPGSALA